MENSNEYFCDVTVSEKGVPQGSVLDLLLFIYINDLSDIFGQIKTSNVRQTDD